jgi:inhibitor of cysteine peptidase
MRQLEANANGQTVELTPGEELEVHLTANPTTGFRWVVRADGSPPCTITNSGVTPDGTTPGRGGTASWRVRAVQPGECDLELAYQRPWEDRPAAEAFRLHLVVR